ncbi:hypothetical protein, conserved [Trypanosoma brucei gambiense DAL972]|uniref:Uncharacterized protein n=1 Tax=Trypanosoma brucei gambiense (strain MHOM/CI/86/DAL972) TaxID=679716 RepID=D0AAP6_TRYB9|nr:hypothetical protein, conserved [Trypanosoma brucei gambiense DAL972]CBH18747.1 hypothetical protein, conserved [Trypanosoma brucei gambiense DAL972]|eukprot:XP_011781011.1 hypothetical protein, conserved [Trypanosoma brucei gambiense DAL972]
MLCAAKFRRYSCHLCVSSLVFRCQESRGGASLAHLVCDYWNIMLNPGDHPEQLSAVAAFAVCDNASATQPALRVRRDPTFSPPVSAQQWVDVAMSCLQRNNVPLERLMSMMEDTSRALVDDEEEGSGSSPPMPTAHHSQHSTTDQTQQDDDDSYCVAGINAECEGGLAPSTTFPTVVGSRRWLAARFLLLGSRLGVQGGTEVSLREAVRLAERAVSAHCCPLTILQLCTACYCLGREVQESGGRSTLEGRVRKLLEYSSGLVMARNMSNPMDAILLAKQAWLSALIGEEQRAMEIVKFLLKRCQAEAEVLVLLALLHSASGEYEEASKVAGHAGQMYPLNVLCGVVFTALQNVVDDADHRKQKCVENLLAVLVGRVEAASKEAPQEVSSTSGHAVFPVDDSAMKLFSLDDVWSSGGKHKRLIAGHWALLAHVALLVGCGSIAQLAADAGLEYISGVQGEQKQAYCDLLCSAARVKIDLIEGSFDYFLRQRRFAQNWGAAAQLRGVKDDRYMREQRKLLSHDEVLSLQTMLGKALQVGSHCAEAYLLLGRLDLLVALGPGNVSSTRETHLVSAAHYFQLAIDCSPRLTAAHEGMGRVREEQGAIELSLDSFASAAQFAFGEPIIPYERFLYVVL